MQHKAEDAKLYHAHTRESHQVVEELSADIEKGLDNEEVKKHCRMQVRLIRNNESNPENA